MAGELSLEGPVRPTRGALSLAMMAKEEGLRGVVVPEPNAQEAAVVGGITVHHLASLLAATQKISLVKRPSPCRRL